MAAEPKCDVDGCDNRPVKLSEYCRQHRFPCFFKNCPERVGDEHTLCSETKEQHFPKNKHLKALSWQDQAKTSAHVQEAVVEKFKDFVSNKVYKPPKKPAGSLESIRSIVDVAMLAQNDTTRCVGVIKQWSCDKPEQAFITSAQQAFEHFGLAVPTPEAPAGRTFVTFAEPWPHLRRVGGNSAPSKNTGHLMASVSSSKIIVRQFDLSQVLNAPCNAFLDEGSECWSTEGDIATLVKTLLRNVITALNLPFRLTSEAGVQQVRPDMWVVTLGNVPVGLVEVKHPGNNQSEAVDAMNDGRVLGEMYDTLQVLRSFYGTSPCIGILTTITHCRLVSLDRIQDSAEPFGTPLVPASAAAAAAAAAAEPQTPKREAKPQFSDSPPPATPVRIHQLPEDESTDDFVDPPADEAEEIKREVYCSDIYSCTSSPLGGHPSTRHHACLRVYCQGLQLMAQHTHSTPRLNTNVPEVLLKLRKGTYPVCWCPRTALNLPDPDNPPMLENLRWNSIRRPQTTLYAVADLGTGLTGKVWLTCTQSGFPWVIKFPNNHRNLPNLDREAAWWQLIYPELWRKKWVQLETWCSLASIRMPHFAPAPLDERDELLPLVEQCLRSRFAKQGLQHNDVKWRNIGFYTQKGFTHAAVFDLDSVTKQQDPDWVEEAMAYLRKAVEKSPAKEFARSTDRTAVDKSPAKIFFADV